MALPQMDTAWRPDFALGAYVSGQNAANSESSAQEELIRQYLANQREVKSQPLDMDIKQYEADLARAKSGSKSYIPWVMRGYEGQMKSQDAAGESAQALRPFKDKAEQGKLENETEVNNLLRTFQKLNSVVMSGGDVDPNTGQVVPASPNVLQALKAKRDQIGSLLGNDPKQIAQMEELAKKHEYALELAKLRGENMMSLQQAKPGPAEKQPTTPEGMLARRILSDETLTDDQKDMLLTQMVTMRAGMGKGTSGEKLDIVKDASGKVSLGNVPAAPAMQSPSEVKQGKLSEKDQQALEWANSNPTDPRAVAIKKKLGR